MKQILAPLILLAVVGCQAESYKSTRTLDILNGFVRVDTASGTVVNSYLGTKGYWAVILTAAHAIDNPPPNGATEGWIKAHVQIPTFNSLGKETENEIITEAYLLEYNTELDYAIIQVRTKNLYPPVKVASYDEIETTSVLSRVISVGRPASQEHWVSVGHISSIDPSLFPGHFGHESKIFLGNSGGPLYNEYGRQVGINLRMAISKFRENESSPITHVGLALKLSTIYRDLGSYKTKLYFGDFK